MKERLWAYKRFFFFFWNCVYCFINSHGNKPVAKWRRAALHSWTALLTAVGSQGRQQLLTPRSSTDSKTHGAVLLLAAALQSCMDLCITRGICKTESQAFLNFYAQCFCWFCSWDHCSRSAVLWRWFRPPSLLYIGFVSAVGAAEEVCCSNALQSFNTEVIWETSGICFWGLCFQKGNLRFSKGITIRCSSASLREGSLWNLINPCLPSIVVQRSVTFLLYVAVSLILASRGKDHATTQPCLYTGVPHPAGPGGQYSAGSWAYGTKPVLSHPPPQKKRAKLLCCASETEELCC